MVGDDRRGGGPLLLCNGRIHTMDTSNPIADAVFVEWGKVKSVGTREELAHSGAAVEFDLQGTALFPGFIDSHVHLLSYGLSLDEVNLTSAESIDDVLGMLSQAPDQGGVVRGSQLDPDSLKEKRYPTRTELDSVWNEKAIFVKRRDEHSCVLNSAAFELISLPEGIKGVEKDSVSGKPSGVLRMQANQFALEKFHGMADETQMKEAYRKASQKALENGVTTVHSLIGADESPERKDCEILISIQDELPVRVIPYYQTRDVDKVLRLGLDRIGGCILLDGSIGSRTAAFTSDYSDDPGNNGSLFFKDEDLISFFEPAEKSGLQIAVHAIGDRAVEQALRCYETVLERSDRSEHRHRIEHAECVREEQYERIAKLGLCLGMQPAFEGFWGEPGGMYEARLGKDRARKLNSVARVHASGISVAGGSDAPITPVDPVYGIHCAVNHPARESAIGLEEAIRMFTTAGAYISHKEGELGAIRPGYSADLVGLSPNPFSISPERIKDAEVVFVVYKGEVAINRLPTPDQRAAREGAGYA